MSGQEGTPEQWQERLQALEAELTRLRRREQELSAREQHLQQRLEEQTAALERTAQNLEQYAYTVSHDLQEPIRMVVGFSQLLQRRHGDALDPKGREYVELIVGSAQRMSAMLNGLLTLSRIGRAQIRQEPVDLNEVYQLARASLATAIDESGAELSAEALPQVRGDRSLLVQLLQHLLTNALEYRAEAPPRIQLGARRRDGDWELTVSDNGIGIDPKFAQRIFQPFQRLHTQREHGGVGVGLTLARRIVERHGGQLWVESAPGAGASFHFTLPGVD
jgi:light-regulated signal transduction histidine kinase (bacteriophytochrome)